MIINNQNLSVTRQLFQECPQNSPHVAGGTNYYLEPSYAPSQYTAYFLSFIYNGVDSNSCETLFRIIDIQEKSIFELKFVIKGGNILKMISQNSEIGGSMISYNHPTILTTLNNEPSVVEVWIKIRTTHYDVTVTGAPLKPVMAVDSERLLAYSQIAYGYRGSECLKIDDEKSFIQHGGNKFLLNSTNLYLLKPIIIALY